MTRFNFADWKLSGWVTGNWATIKELLKVGAPLVVTWIATGSYWQTGVGVVLGKFVLDSIHYYIKE